MTAATSKPKLKPNQGAEKLTTEGQHRRFQELAKEAGFDWPSEARSDDAQRIVTRQQLRS